MALFEMLKFDNACNMFDKISLCVGHIQQKCIFSTHAVLVLITIPYMFFTVLV